MENKQLLLDMDGVLADFLGGALTVLNKKFNRDITIEEYATKFGKWETYDYYGITIKQFWNTIHHKKNFWYNLEPLPWAKELYEFLSSIGHVTIVTSPSADPRCALEKLRWLKKHLDIRSEAVFIGQRKYLMAGNGLLIDDYYANVENFRRFGGEAILVPSNWNTYPISYSDVIKSFNI